jgi:hypothetical protein
MAISKLAVACCAFCALFMCYQKCLNFEVLKVLPSGIVFVRSLMSLVDVVRFLFLRQHLGGRSHVVWGSSDLFGVVTHLFLIQHLRFWYWILCCQMVNLQWFEPSVSAFHHFDCSWWLLGMLCLSQPVWRCQIFVSEATSWSHHQMCVSELGSRVSRDLRFDAIGYCRCWSD